jgi:hypothetical protein
VSDSGSDLWLVARLARQSLGSGTLRGYWPGLAMHGATRSALVTWLARVVYVALVPVVPLVAARHRRLVARALESVVRAVVAGVEVRTAVDRAVALLEHKGLDPVQARVDLERLLAGFLSSHSRPARDAADERRSASGVRPAG